MKPARDRSVLAFVLFCLAVAFTLELYWVVEARQLSRQTGWMAAAFRFYGRADRAYYDSVTGFELGLESFNVWFTQPLLIVLLIGIWRRAPWRYPLQLGVSAYVCYSTALYLVGNHLSGYADMPRHDFASMLLFYLPNLPWLLGNAWLALDAAGAISQAFRAVEQPNAG